MSSIAVLYGTTADDNVRPVLCNDSGQLVTDQSGGTNWYENLYAGGTEGDPSISLLSDGSIDAAGSGTFGGQVQIGHDISTASGTRIYSAGSIYTRYDTGVAGYASWKSFNGGFGDANLRSAIYTDGSAYFADDLTAVGDVYGRKFIPADGYDVSKIGKALSTIHDVIESVDDLQGLKNLFHLLLDDLKSDPTPPEPPE